MSLDYTSYTLRLATFITSNPDNIDYAPLIPATIDYAEQRIYRELNLLGTRVANSSLSCTANNRLFTIPVPATGPYITVTSLNIITPVGQTAAGTGIRNRVASLPMSLVDFIGTTNTSPSATTVPAAFYMRDQTTVVFAPSPGATFNVEVIGTIRPNPLSYTNTTTFLTTYLPDVFVAASMIYFSKAVADKNCGIQQSPDYWEKEYQALASSANSEETRKRYNDEVNKP